MGEKLKTAKHINLEASIGEVEVIKQPADAEPAHTLMLTDEIINKRDKQWIDTIDKLIELYCCTSPQKNLLILLKSKMERLIKWV